MFGRNQNVSLEIKIFIAYKLLPFSFYSLVVTLMFFMMLWRGVIRCSWVQIQSKLPYLTTQPLGDLEQNNVAAFSETFPFNSSAKSQVS